MRLGPNQPWSCSFLAKTGGQLGRKCCSWLQLPCTIPIPGFIINVCKSTLTLECFCISLQPCTRVIRARVALKLSVFVQIWGQLDTKWFIWMKNPCTIPIPGFINLSHERILTLECFCSNLQPFAHVIWAKSALELLNFGLNWGSAWQKMLWLAWNAMCDFHPICHDPCLWTKFDFEMLLQLSPTMCTCYLGLSSPGIGHFWPNLGVSLAVNGVFGWKTCRIPIPCFVVFSYEPILTLKCFCSSLQPCIHAIWAKSAMELLVFGPNWGSAWQKILWLA